MLFNTTSEVQEYTALANLNFGVLLPVLKGLEESVLIPYMGSDLYDDLDNKVSQMQNTPLSEIYSDLLDKCRCVLSGFAVYKHIPKGELQISSSGIRRAETDSLKTPYGYQIGDLREAYLRDGERAIENLLKFLVRNKSDLNLWTESEAFADYSSLFIQNGNDLKLLFSMIVTPHRIYWMLRSKMQEVESFAADKIGNELYTTLKSKISNNVELSPDESLLLFSVKKAIAYLSIASAIPYLNCRIDADGITMLSNISAVATKDSTKRMPASDPAVSNFIISAQKDGSEWMGKVDKIVKEKFTVPSTQSESQNTPDCITHSTHHYRGLASL